jgi:hypothetical protein
MGEGDIAMDDERDYRPGQVPLPGAGQPGADPSRPPAGNGIRRARRMSNWTLAALLAGTGAATVALARHALPAATGTTGTAAGSTAAATGGQAATAGQGGPQVSHSVATTSGSGASVTTSTQTVNGKTVIVRTVHPAYHDN